MHDQEYWHQHCKTCAKRFDCPDYYDDIWIPDCEKYGPDNSIKADKGSQRNAHD